MIVVVDTNVLVSSAIRGGLPQRLIRRVVADPGIRWVATPELVAEYLELLGRPKLPVKPWSRNSWMELVQAQVRTDSPALPTVHFPRDPKDAKVLSAALAWKADYLVTGDRDFADAPDIGGTRIVTPREFAEVQGIE